MKKIITITFVTLFATTLIAQVPNGAYVPKNDVAKALHYAKFDFIGGNKVKGYIGINGEPLGVVYDYIYTLNGKTLSLSEEGKNGSVELTYDKTHDEIILLDELFGTEGAVWRNDGTKYKTTENQNSTVPVQKEPTQSSGKGLNGIYVPVNEISKGLHYAKFDFISANKVKGYIGMNGQSLGVAYEYTYTLIGTTLSLSEAGQNGSVEFSYDSAKDQILLSTGSEYPAKWGREGQNDCIFLSAPQVIDAPKTVIAGSSFTLRWKQVECATRYIVYWSFFKNDGTKKNEGNSGWTDKLEWSFKVPDESGIMYINIYAGDAYKEGEHTPDLSVEVIDLSNFNKELADTCALYSLLAYDDTRITNMSASLSTRENTQEYIDRNYKDRAGNPNIYYTGDRSDQLDFQGKNSPWILQAQLRYDGYEYIESKNYGDDDEHNISYTLAVKTKNGNSQLAVILRGTDEVEWRGNMDVWKDKNTQGAYGRHYSFQKANEELQKAIKIYIDEHNLKNIFFLITGHSRGAAVANLLAVDLNERKFEVNEMKKNVAYTFATPNNTTNAKVFNNIFNFCFDDDFVPQVPLKENWSFYKSGITFSAIAESLFNSDNTFKSLMDNYSYLSNNREPSFDKDATDLVIKSFSSLAPTVNIYYTEELKMDCIGLEHDKTLHGFMRDYIADAAIGKKTAQFAIFLKQPEMGILCNDVYTIVDYFVDNIETKKSVNDTHQAFTYYIAVKTGGFKEITISTQTIQSAQKPADPSYDMPVQERTDISTKSNISNPITTSSNTLTTTGQQQAENTPTQASHEPTSNSLVSSNNPVVQELATCKTQRQVQRVARQSGLVIGRNTSKGFTYPEKCMIAVFNKNGALEALLDVGGNTRTDLLSGSTVQNPEQFYNRDQYSLWYMQQK